MAKIGWRWRASCLDWGRHALRIAACGTRDSDACSVAFRSSSKMRTFSCACAARQRAAAIVYQATLALLPILCARAPYGAVCAGCCLRCCACALPLELSHAASNGTAAAAWREDPRCGVLRHLLRGKEKCFVYARTRTCGGISAPSITYGE